MTIYFEKTYQRSFGTFPLKGQELHDAVQAAAELGYRAFDTAQMYENEAETGAAIKATGLPRDDLCITTKVDIANFSPDKFLPSVEESLRKLQIDRVDVLLLHWPTPGGNIGPSLEQLQKAHDQGLTRHIGISNYTAQMMRDAKSIVDVPIVTNQVEFHPLLNQDKLLAVATETGIPLASYCSVARGEVFRHAIFSEIGAAYGKSAAQVVLRWILQKGVSINTMSTKPANIRANFDVMDFTLSSVDMARIEEMTKTGYRIVGKDLVPYAPDFD
ncbi:2,5-diketo-D-gluconate reductase B [Rhodovulum imhoffii]|uniref:2,5-diketo-D-gluconate reductase B n=1 Tax=Rhodovulum imhoffii TaxID=365340 RepID=A0A2T5BUG3_9RHOB|nr:aldo/keto reductase [Rhodovulum imhoffii]MBK5932396.1 oxidoreductase [Rhodovulum imhoffii]PTN03165.1 2,5-diketo-D-gluconate reductase B [Rhodovulum imhoffii]